MQGSLFNHSREDSGGHIYGPNPELPSVGCWRTGLGNPIVGSVRNFDWITGIAL